MTDAGIDAIIAQFQAPQANVVTLLEPCPGCSLYVLLAARHTALSYLWHGTH